MMLSRIISQTRPNSSLIVRGSKMLCCAKLRNFSIKKEVSRPYKSPPPSRPSRKSLWQWDPFIDEYSLLHPFQLEMEKNLRDLHNKFGEYFGETEFPSCSTGIFFISEYFLKWIPVRLCNFNIQILRKILIILQ